VSLSGTDGGGFAALLLVFGVALFLGTALSGPLADRAPRVGVLLFPGVLGAGMLLIVVAGGSIAGLFTARARSWSSQWTPCAAGVVRWSRPARNRREAPRPGLTLMTRPDKRGLDK